MATKQEIVKGKLTSDMNFQEKIWALTARIPAGSVVTYADLAHAVNSAAYRAVGQAMHHNPYAPDVPCHRVVGSNGKLTGFAGGLAKKKRLLESEGVTVDPHGRIDLKRFRAELT